MSPASSALAATAAGCSQRIGQRAGSMYSVRITARPGARTSCGTPAGTHSARLDGSTHPPASVLMVSTPWAAQASW